MASFHPGVVMCAVINTAVPWGDTKRSATPFAFESTWQISRMAGVPMGNQHDAGCKRAQEHVGHWNRFMADSSYVWL